MNKEILMKVVEVEDNLIVITEEIKTTKDRNALERELTSVQRQISNVVERNRRSLEEYAELKEEELSIKDMIAQLPQDDLEIIG